MPDQQSYQLKLPEAEMSRLGMRVLTDYRNALADHNARIQRWTEYFRRWRCRVDPPAMGEEENSNYPVPVIKWHIAAKWAKNADSIFGDEAEIVAVPVGPSDYRNDLKIGKYMTWRVFNDMKLTNRLIQFELYKLLYGRAVAYCPWTTRGFETPAKNGVKKQTYYKGPDFIVVEPDDYVVPAEQAETLHDFSWIIRKYRATPQQLLVGEDDDRYQGIKDDFERILRMSIKRTQRDYEGDDIKLERDDAEGVTMQNGLSIGNTLLVLSWYGKWRMLKKGEQDADEYSVTDRDLYESDLVVHFIPDLNKVIGVQDLRSLYPASPKPRPFVEAAFKRDGSYWCEGLAEELIDTEDEVRVNHNLGTDGQQLAVSPLVGYRPAAGFDSETFKLRPGLMLPLDNPETDLKIFEIPVNLEAIAQKESAVLAYAERLTGISDMSMGRAPDRPNSPKTARGTMALLEEGNVRMTLDNTTLREDYAEMLQHFWMLEWQFADDSTFFRVTEDDANGAFPVRNGGSILTQADRDGRYDFRLQLANSKWSREAEKERTLARYQLDLQNPLIAQNPVALWHVTKDAHDALGDPNFQDLVPEPPQPDLPKNPKEEWSLIQQGEIVHVNPLDNDELHMIRHAQDLQTAIEDKYDDPDAIQALKVHYMQQVQQLQEKKLVQALAERMVQRAQEMGGGNPMAATQVPPGMQSQLARPQAAPGPKAPGPMEENSQQEQPAA